MVCEVISIEKIHYLRALIFEASKKLNAIADQEN